MQTVEKVRSDFDVELDLPTRNRERLKILKEENIPKSKTLNNKVSTVYASQSKLMFVGTIIFAMFMTLIYRYNLINARNMENLKIAKDYDKIKAEVSLAQIELERRISLSTIESYAKQKLGMQKPTKSQIIYIDTRNIDDNIQKDETSNNQMQK